MNIATIFPPWTFRYAKSVASHGGVRDLITNNTIDADDILHQESLAAPHTTVLAGLLAEALNPYRDWDAVSLGVDGIKEYLIAKAVPTLRIHCVDIDGAFIAGCAHNLPHYRLTWGEFDLVHGNYKQIQGRSIAILSQMDYQFDDTVLAGMFQSLRRIGIKVIVVISPSIQGPESLREICAVVKRHLHNRRLPDAGYRRTASRLAQLAKPYRMASIQWHQLPSHQVALAVFKGQWGTAM